DQDAVGAARIIDISDETKPRSVANIRLQINQPEDHKAARDAGDPGTGSPAQGYAAHYCNIPTRVDPKIVACSFIASGLRVFDISALLHPRARAPTPPPRRSPIRRTATTGRTTRCRSPRSFPSAARSGTRTARAAST